MEVLARYDGVPGCNLLEVRGLKLLNCWDQPLVRFKKVGSMVGAQGIEPWTSPV